MPTSQGPSLSLLPQPTADDPAREAHEDDWFEDMTAQSGVDFTYRNGREGGQFTILETIGGGVAMVDYDQDGDLDLFFTGGGRISSDQPIKITGRSSALFRNDGDWRFVDVTEDAHLSDASFYTHGCTVVDVNRDGFPDLFVTGFGGCRLYLNQGGKTFEDATARLGLAFEGWSTAAAAADVDQDGWPDLYVACYLQWSPEDSVDFFCGDRKRGVRDVCPPQLFPSAQDRLFRNLGDGRFEEATAKARLSDQGRGLGVVASDLNEDGWIDFYVANDAGANHLYLGASDMRFQEVGLRSGTAFQEYGLAEGSMGVDLADYNGDSLADLWVTNFELEDNSLYQGQGNAIFMHTTVATGLAGHCFPYVGFGTGFVDFDSDGWLDIFVINGNVFYQTGGRPFEQPAFLFHNVNGDRFQNVSDKGGPFFSVPHPGRGAAVGDLDNDGAPDLVVSHVNEPVSLLRNRRSPPNWIALRLRATQGEPSAIGAKVTMTYNDLPLVRSVRSGAGYLSHFDSRIIMPLDNAAGCTVKVKWPGRNVETFPNLTAGHTNEIVEGKGTR